MRAQGKHPARQRRVINLGSFRLFSHRTALHQVSAPIPRPLQAPGGSSTVKCSALYGSAAVKPHFYRSVAGSRDARTFTSLALRPLLKALYSSVAGAAYVGTAVWSWVEWVRVAGVDWTWNHGRWRTSELPGMRDEDGWGDRPLTRAGVAGPESLLTFSHLSPGSLHVSCHPGLSILFHVTPSNLSWALSVYSFPRPGPLLLNFRLGSFSPCPGAWLPSTILKAPDYLHNHPS